MVPHIEKVINPLTGEIMTREQYEELRREDTWNHYPEPYPVDPPIEA